MDKFQAHSLLVQATSLLQLGREDHQKIIQALEVLKPQEPKTSGSKS